MFVSTFTVALNLSLCMISNLLSLQTFLFTRKIIITNLGIYLSSFAVLCILSELVYHLDLLLVNVKLSSYDVRCWLTKTVDPSITSCLHWLNGFIATERALIECLPHNYSLYDSRGRSFFASILLVLTRTAWTSLPNLFYRQDASGKKTDEKMFWSCDIRYSFTRIGDMIFTVFAYSQILPSILFIAGSVLVLRHLAQYRGTITLTQLTLKDYLHLCSKHGDFFTPLIVYNIIGLALFITLNQKSKFMSRKYNEKTDVIISIFYLFSRSFTALTFFTYVYANNVYREAFWLSSPVGHGSRKLKSLLQCKRNVQSEVSHNVHRTISNELSTLQALKL